jgi:hypothetical protein
MEIGTEISQKVKVSKVGCFDLLLNMLSARESFIFDE